MKFEVTERKNLINQGTFSLCWNYQVGCLEQSRELSALGLRRPNRNLHLWVAGSLWPVELIHLKRFYMVATAMPGQTLQWAMDGY